MSADDDKDVQKALPLDLAARTQIATLRTVEGKGGPLVMTQPLRNVRVLQQPPGAAGGSGAIITTNIVQQAVLKPGIISQPPPGANLTIQQRPQQISLPAPLVAQQQQGGTSYHVPRGPAVVANIAAPRSNVTTFAKAHGYGRPPRTPSPAQGTAWLTTNSSNGGQIKGAPTVLSSPVRGATVTGKQQMIRPGTILQNAIIAQPAAQIHQFKTGGGNIQAIGSSVSLAQVLPARTQAVVYSANTTAFPHARLTVGTTVSTQRQPQVPRTSTQVATARLTVPVNVSSTGGATAGRIVAPQTVLTSGGRISTVPAPPVLGGGSARIVTTQTPMALGRITVTTPAVVSTNNVIGTKLSALNLTSLVAVANAPQQRAQGAKVIAQPAQGTIHLAPLQAPLKSATPVVTSATTRSISVQPAAMVPQRPSPAVAIAKVFPLPAESQQGLGGSGVQYIHSAQQQQSAKRMSPGPQTTPASSSSSTSSSSNMGGVSSGGGKLTAYSTYFYDPDGRPLSTQQPPRVEPPNAGAAAAQAPQMGGRSTSGTPVHGIVASSNPAVRYSQVMLVDQGRVQQQPFTHTPLDQEAAHQSLPSKTTSSPRPTILRKREHDGSSPMKATKNLTPLLTNLPLQSPTTPVSPPSRPDSRGNGGHSSGGSTTISATSSPGLAEVNEDSMPAKEEEDVKQPPMEMSPRKKPRKQQLTGSNDLVVHHDDMQFISDNNGGGVAAAAAVMKKDEEDEDADESDGGGEQQPCDGRSRTRGGGGVGGAEPVVGATVRKPATASLLNGYKQSWKSTHNHYQRYSDVRPKDERRPTIMDIANECRILDKINGWKVHHLTTQMDDLADQEHQVYSQLNDLLKNTEQDDKDDRDVDKINELIKGNMQRIKIINDGMVEAKGQIMRIFDHKVYVSDIITRCASKRNFKKRDKQ